MPEFLEAQQGMRDLLGDIAEVLEEQGRATYTVAAGVRQCTEAQRATAAAIEDLAAAQRETAAAMTSLVSLLKDKFEK